MSAATAQLRPRTGLMANTAVLVSYSVFETVVVFLFTVFLARYLGTGDFGRLGFALSYSLLFSVLADPGISVAMTKLVATSDAERQKQFIATGLALRALLSVAVLAISMLPFGFSAYMRRNAVFLTIILVSEHLRSMTLYLCSVFRGHQRNSYEAFSLGVERMAALAAGWWLLRQGYGLQAIGWLYLGARLASLLFALVLLVRRIGWFPLGLDRLFIADIWRQALPLAVLLVCERANMYVPPVIVTFFAGEHATGIFQAAFKTVMPAVLLCTAVSASLYAPMASRFKVDPLESARLYRLGVRGLLHIALPGAAVCLVFGRPLMLLLYGGPYAESVAVLRCLAPYFVSIVIIAMSHLFMPAIDRQRKVAAVSIISVLLNVGSGLVLAPRWGPVGAGASLAVAQIVVAVIYGRLASRYGGARLALAEWRTMAVAFAASLGALALLERNFAASPLVVLLTAGLLSAAIYVLVLFAQGGVCLEERHALRSAGRRLLPRLA
ncbi:MAG TPA: flippase [Terriglobales bacterium]|nr:flippase [Terriglobales bacterium]